MHYSGCKIDWFAHKFTLNIRIKIRHVIRNHDLTLPQIYYLISSLNLQIFFPSQIKKSHQLFITDPVVPTKVIAMILNIVSILSFKLIIEVRLKKILEI